MFGWTGGVDFFQLLIISDSMAIFNSLHIHLVSLNMYGVNSFLTLNNLYMLVHNRHFSMMSDKWIKTSLLLWS